MSTGAQVIIEGTKELLAERGARFFMDEARRCAEGGGRFFVALSGGSTPRPMHRMLAGEPYLSDIPWHAVEVFWVDERCVPIDDPASNYGGARRDFLDRVPLPAGQVHPMPAYRAPDEGAIEYQRELRRAFQGAGGGEPVFDLVFLGVGKDGHTASLFPGHAALDEKKRLVTAVKGGDPDVHRLTMTYPLLNKGRNLVFMAAGREKAKVVKTILQGPSGSLPAQRLRPVNGRVIWLLDREAAALL